MNISNDRYIRVILAIIIGWFFEVMRWVSGHKTINEKIESQSEDLEVKSIINFEIISIDWPITTYERRKFTLNLLNNPSKFSNYQYSNVPFFIYKIIYKDSYWISYEKRNTFEEDSIPQNIVDQLEMYQNDVLPWWSLPTFQKPSNHDQSILKKRLKLVIDINSITLFHDKETHIQDITIDPLSKIKNTIWELRKQNITNSWNIIYIILFIVIVIIWITIIAANYFTP